MVVGHYTMRYLDNYLFVFHLNKDIYLQITLILISDKYSTELDKFPNDKSIIFGHSYITDYKNIIIIHIICDYILH